MRTKKISITWLLMVLATVLWSQSRVSFLHTKLHQAPIDRTTISRGIATLPYALSGNMVLVEALLDGEKKKFLLDTGAPGLVLNSRDETPGSIQAKSLNGDFQVGETSVQSFIWRETTWTKLTAISLDLSHLERHARLPVAGLIGMDMLKAQEMLFDPERQQLVFVQSDKVSLTALEPPRASLPIRYFDHLPMIQLEIDGIKLWFGIDTGAGTSLIDQEVCQLFEANLFASGGQEEIEALNQPSRIGSRKIFENVLLGNINLGDQLLVATDLNNLKSHDPSVKIAGLLGMDLLSKIKFSINLKNHVFNLW
ncbi:MAG: aspartyl protease family protein [Haliscomenobacter sp.]|nr:aspartyl protease family protein [Haliscomenobacter sp.]